MDTLHIATVITGTTHQEFIQAFIGIHHFMIRSTGIHTDCGLTPPDFILAHLVSTHIITTFIMADMDMVETDTGITGMHGQAVQETYAIMTEPEMVKEEAALQVPIPAKQLQQLLQELHGPDQIVLQYRAAVIQTEQAEEHIVTAEIQK
jgi:hypothetical protein